MPNLIKNGGFEEGRKYWEVQWGYPWEQYAAITDEEAYSGRYSAWTWYGIRQKVTIPVSDAYYVRFYFKVHPEKPREVVTCYIPDCGDISFYYENGTVRPGEPHPPSPEGFCGIELEEVSPAGRGWFRVTLKALLKKNSYYLTLYTPDVGGTKQGVYFDDVYLGVQPPPEVPAIPLLIAGTAIAGLFTLLYLVLKKKLRI